MPSAGAVIVFVLSIFFGALYAPLESNTSFVTRDTADYPQAKRVLLVTAHPDDEAMFFTPTILSLAPNRDISFFHVCLSNGNADGLGSTRRTELEYSLDILGVSKRNRWLLDHPYVTSKFLVMSAYIPLRELQDNITVQWDPYVIATVLGSYVSGLKIDTVSRLRFRPCIIAVIWLS
jgi:N-acetylglucosaminylphosphatidylinositol deacetylase